MPQKSYAYRRGDCQVIHDDNHNAIIIDGGEDDICNKAIILDHGKLIAQGDAKEICAKYNEMVKGK